MKSTCLCAIAALALAACGGTNNPSDAKDAAGVAPGLDAAQAAGLDASSAATPPDAGPTDSPPTVAISGLVPYAMLKGTASVTVDATDDLGVTKIDLYVGAETPPIKSQAVTPGQSPYKIWVGSTRTGDGATTLFARATDTTGHTADSARVPVVVCNLGTDATIGEGNTSTFDIPAGYTSGELDQKFHWDNPAGINKIVGVLSYTTTPASPWTLGLSVGWGECPDNGQIIGNEVVAATPQISVEAVPTGADIQTGQHFIHVRPADPLSHKGEQLGYVLHVYLWP